jgi:3-keto-disaccharide hydrolase
LRPFARTSFHHQPEAQHPKSSAIHKDAGRLPHLFYAAEKFENFLLRLDFLLPHPRGAGNDNSGVFVRFRDPRLQVPPNYPPPNVPGNDATVAVDTGYEIQIDEEARGDTRISEADGLPFNHTGAIYKIRSFGTGVDQQDYQNAQRLRSEQWHRLEIEVNQQNFIVRLNGLASTHFRRDPGEPFRGHPPSSDPESGFIGLQSHTGQVAFANVAVQKL